MVDQKYDQVVRKLTQEIVRKGEEIPERYILKEGVVIPPAIDAHPELWEEVLTVDYSLLSKPSYDPLAKKELEKLHYALKNWGCFQITNHGMTNLVENVLDVTKKFFALPLEEKLKSSLPGQFVGGYGNVTNMYNDRTENWYDQLFLNLYPDNQRRLDIWPEQPETFKLTLEEYATKIVKLGETVLKAMALSLELKEDSYLKKMAENPSMNTKFSYYPPCSRPDRVLGARPHSDPATLTILLPDDKVEGLDILKDDQWYKVPIKTGAIFINLGDSGEVMSNGIFKSVVHRVVTNQEKDRVSIAAFFMPGPDGEIGPIEELITKTQPQVYKKVDLDGYRKVVFQAMGPDAKVLDLLKV